MFEFLMNRFDQPFYGIQFHAAGDGGGGGGDGDDDPEEDDDPVKEAARLQKVLKTTQSEAKNYRKSNKTLKTEIAELKAAAESNQKVMDSVLDHLDVEDVEELEEVISSGDSGRGSEGHQKDDSKAIRNMQKKHTRDMAKLQKQVDSTDELTKKVESLETEKQEGKVLKAIRKAGKDAGVPDSALDRYAKNVLIDYKVSLNEDGDLEAEDFEGGVSTLEEAVEAFTESDDGQLFLSQQSRSGSGSRSGSSNRGSGGKITTENFDVGKAMKDPEYFEEVGKQLKQG